MAALRVGGDGNEYDKYYQSPKKGGKGVKKQPKKPKLTPQEQARLRKMLKLRSQTNTKYGVNLPSAPPQLPPGTNTKYGINTPSSPPQLPPGTNTKYGINTPNK